MTSKIEVISLTEHEFWGREFEAKVSKKNGNYLETLNKLIDSGVKPVIQVGPSVKETQDLRGFPKDSLIVQFHADETYLPKINFRIIRNPAVSLILRSYPIPKFMLFQFFRSHYFGFCDLLDNFSIRNLLEYLKLVAAGMIMVKRQFMIAVMERIYSKESLAMPLGYNDLFAESFYAVNKIGNKSSLIEFAINNKDLGKSEYEYAFVGQLGKFTRRVAISSISEFSSKVLILRQNYGGAIGIYGATLESGIENVHALTKSKFALCPPGNYSSNTFRIAESLICGAVPLFNQTSISDPIATYCYLDEQILQLPKQWKKKIWESEFFENEVIGKALMTSLKNLRSEVEIVKNRIQAAQNIK